MTTDYKTRPVWSPAIGRSRRAQVWFWREQSAFDLAARLTGPDAVTEDAYDAAASLLDSVQRYALADARAWELDNDSCYSCHTWLVQRQKSLDKRREKLAKRLAEYGIKIVNYGLYPSLIDQKTGETLHYLHYFD